MLIFLLTVLTAYRLTRVVTTDGLFTEWREAFFLRFPPTAHYASFEKKRSEGGSSYWKLHPSPIRKTSKIGELISCPWCIGFWISGATVLAVAQFTSLPLPILWWFATSAVVGLIARNLDA